MCKNLEKLLSNKFQVIVFETMAKNCLKVNRFTLIFSNLFFQSKIMTYNFVTYNIESSI